MIRLCKKTAQNIWIYWKKQYFCSPNNDSVAQQVEHIPFKDGVLGSNPSGITESLVNQPFMRLF